MGIKMNNLIFLLRNPITQWGIPLKNHIGKFKHYIGDHIEKPRYLNGDPMGKFNYHMTPQYPYLNFHYRKDEFVLILKRLI